MDIIDKKIELVDETISSKYVYALKQVQLERIRLEVELNKKINDLELDYHSKLVEFDNKRKQIINGEYTPTEQEFKYEFMTEEEKPTEPTEKGIPKFWQTIFHNLDVLSDMVQQKDDSVLDHLVDVRLVLLSEPRGYRLEFEFSENEYMTNKVLTKDYYFADSFDPTEPLQYEGLYISYSKGTKIEWKSADKDPTQTKISKKLKHKSSNQVKTVEKVEKIDSFFNFFDPVETKIEEADDETKELLLADFDIAETLRHNVIPRAVIYFTGEGIEDDDEFDEEMGDLADYDDDDDDEDDEEDDDDEANVEEDGKKVRKLKANGRGGNTEVPSECKQQ